ncbi:hypothetical protein H2201_005780 [Coniosporium apollinis]|uniref:Amino acid permease/ SLC12A domain-containing protein n=1 Tax=Coniosporium apollinis TaxID=61459 RepID=A0ABQ9NS06_9PEZI|nr:hypothetical protein H2201_005780 [Coniosporium apollinis]
MAEKTMVYLDEENGHVTPTSSSVVGRTDELLHSGTQRGLKSRHAQMIALGGTIGTGLFVGTGQALRMGGPAFLLAAYCLITVLVFGIVTGTTEMSSYLPVPGSGMAYYANRYVSRSLGFALGWMYWYVFAITVPAEVTATSLVIQYWEPPVHIAVWITLTILVVVALNSLPVRYYGETEFWFASIKVFGIIGLLIMAVVLVLGGGPKHDRLGFRYWKDPGPVNEYIVDGASGRLCAFVATTVFSVFAFAFAPELLVVTGGEMESPRRNLPVAGKRYFYRLVVFYVLGVFAIGLIVASDNPSLLGGGKGAGSSPWAVAIREAGIRGLDSVVNAIIITSAWSAGNSYLYLATRALYSLAMVGHAPKIFLRCTKSGVPYYCVIASGSFSVLAYLNCASGGATVFNWFVNLINTGGFQSWIACTIIYLRFRKATTVQNITDLPYRSRFQPYLSWVSGSMFTLLLLLNGFRVFLKGQWSTASFLTAYIGIPVFLGLYFGHRFSVGREEPWAHRSSEVDLTTGLDVIIAAEKPARKHEKWYQKWKAIYE